MTDHTPTPWKMVSEPNFENGITYTSVEPVTPDEATMRPLAMADGSYHVCRTTHTAAEHKIAVHRANAAFIVKACNSHDVLVKALKALQLQALQSSVNDPANEWGCEALELTRAALAQVQP